ncbi:phospholipid-binding protein MlaC [Gallibacterium melopsittaci]|uniref:Phospholipid-binding protein MlaC n=1 Tax=Gallibacterium melopsittaci TaxID=516063 RepID=A0ABV6HUX3_9PAST
MLKRYTKRVVRAVLTVGLMLTSVFAVAEQNPYQLMQQASDKLFADIGASQSQIKQNPNYLRTIVKQDLMPYVHVKYAGSLVLGNYFKTATAEQREAFFTAFGNFIEQSYAQVLTFYNGQKVSIEPEKSVEGKNIVNIRVVVEQNNGAAPIKLDFKWRKNSKTNEWQAYDMAAEGVSMVETKKNEWSGVLRQKGIEALTAQIEKSASLPVTLDKK